MPRGVRKTREPEGRNERPLLGGFHAKMVAPERKGFERRYVNDDPGRVEMFQQAGYSLVSDEMKAEAEGRAAYKAIRVGTHQDGSPKLAYLMEKPMKLHLQDQARKAAVNDEREAEIFAHRTPELEQGADRSRFYTKEASIK